jgi:PAS domain S-box-containing protein
MAIVRSGRAERHGGFESLLLDQVQAAVIATDLTGVIRHWNRHAERLFGWSREEALGQPIMELVVLEEQTERAAEVMDRLRSGASWEGEFPIRCKSGSSVLCYVTDSPIQDEEGQPAGMVAIAVDITGRKRHESRLAARTAVTYSLAEADSLPQAAPRIIEAICENLGWDLGAIWRVDLEARVIRCIDAWHLPSVDVAEFEAVTRRSVFPPGVGLPGSVWSAATPRWIPDVLQDTNFPRAAVAEKDGLHGAFGFPILLGGHVLGVLEFFSREIHEPDEELMQTMTVIGSQIGQFMERLEAQKAVRQSDARKTAILLSALDAVITMDGEGNIVEFNPPAERAFGRKSEDVVGKEMAELIIPPSLRERHREGLRHYLKTGEGPLLGQRTELTALRADGSEFPVELAITRVDLPGPPLFTGYIRDVTDRKRAEDELRRSRDQLEAIFQGVTEGISVLDASGKLLYANDAAARLSGYPSGKTMVDAPGDEVFQRFHIMDEAGQPLAVSELPGRKALEGLSEERTIRYRDVRTQEERWSIIRGAPVFDQAGRVQFSISIFHDVTERRRTEEAQRFLAEASDLLSRSLDYHETLAQVARLAVLSLADWCSVDMAQEDGSIQHLAVEHLDPSKVEMAKSFGERYPIDPDSATGVANVIRTGKPEQIPEITDDMLVEASPDEEILRILRELGLRSVITAPLVAAGRTLGAITFVSAESGRRYTTQDLAYAEQIADRAALAVNNARLFRQRDEIARVLQRSLVPPDIPVIPGLEIATFYQAAGEAYDVGGDFYDVFDTGDGGWAMVIGDVCGKGPEAAAITGVARHAIRTAAMKERRPSEILSILNDALIQDRPNHTFCTVTYVRLRPTDGRTRITVCNAGHPLPMVLRADGTVETAGLPGTLLGVFPDPELSDRAVELGPGDAVVLYTDGVTEELATVDTPGRETLLGLMPSYRGQDAEGIASSVVRAVLDARPRPPRDDIAVVVARVRP